jgi:HemY protein
MGRSLFYLVQLAVFVALAIWLVENPGDLRIDWLGWRLETTFALFLVLMAAGLWLATVGLRTVVAAVTAPVSFFRSWGAHRREEGYKALVQGMAAVAVGDAEEAKRLARDADRLLHDPGLTRLLSAQAAALSGDAAAAAKYFAALRDNPETAFLGLVGLMRLASARGDEAHVLELAEEAYALRPDASLVATTRLYGYARAGRWVEAQAALFDAVKRGMIPRPKGRGHRAALLIERARLAETPAEGLELAAKARESVADFVPAIVAEARLTAELGRKEKARKLIHDLWPTAPHPDLALALRDLYEGETASFILRKVQAMAERIADHPESRLAVAETAIDGGFWDDARAQLSALDPGDLGPRACTLWARLEERQNDDIGAARRWLEQAAHAAADATWTCESCGAVSAAWSATCGNCGAFDTVAWARPPRAMVMAPTTLDDADGPVVELTADHSTTSSSGSESRAGATSAA